MDFSIVIRIDNVFIILHDLIEMSNICIIIVRIIPQLTISWVERDDDLFPISF